MTLDQIKELAGHRDVSPWVIKLVQDAVEIERENSAKMQADCTLAAVLAEREACAKVVESGVLGHGECAAAIRARGEK